MRQGLAAWQATGAKADRAVFSGPAWPRRMGRGTGTTEGLRHAGRGAGGGGHNLGSASRRPRSASCNGELLLAPVCPDDQVQAEACLQQALDVARRQQAKIVGSCVLPMSLSRLWQQQGKRAEARELLAQVYGWFTEGFDTADLQEAKALLEELGHRGLRQK